MLVFTSGIPEIPDLTHPQELQAFGQNLLHWGRWLLWLFVGFGGVIAAIKYADRRDRAGWLNPIMVRYGRLLEGALHGLLVVAILVGGFFLCATLANRYHHWEQAKIEQIASSVAGFRVEQPAPRVRYEVEEPYISITYIDGKPTEVERQRQISRFLSPSGSDIAVTLNQVTDPATQRWIYQSDFTSRYQVTNTLDETREFFFEVPPPYGYTLLQDYRVERQGQPQEPVNQGEYSFPVQLASGESTEFEVSYQAQGAPRWVYSAGGRLLSQFKLTVLADFPNADFASGIVPSETSLEGKGTRFTWQFDQNVSVRNPFGVFTATQRIRQTGIFPRLLLLAPGIFLWWLLLLYLTVPMGLQDVAVAAAVFFACLLSLTYASRLFDAKLAWGLLLPIFLLFSVGLGGQHRRRWGVMLVTLSGAILPVVGMLVSYTGLTLGIAGLVSVGWLISRYYRAP
ncbi:MAG: hypothetical protein QNJ46_31560 [Leptolyngbyaceae cyanobacterium MO_188.B28]|nr:hypothetical protein [Leptolyngbyaceae cyanobacterium MO_188.B28]